MSKTSRPPGVTTIAVLYAISAMLVLVQAYTAIISSGFRAVIYLGLGAVAAAAVWGLLEAATWGRYLTLGLSVVLFFYSATIVWPGMMNGEIVTVLVWLVRMVLHGWIVVYLLQPKIAATFNSRRRASIGIEPKNPV